MSHAAATHGATAGMSHHEMMAADFRRRFWVCAALTVPVLAMSGMLWGLFSLRPPITSAGSQWFLLAIATVIFIYGGWPFVTGMVSELKHRTPGMMTLVALATTSAYAYSAAIVLGLQGSDFFWELATLVDIMLLGHWIEMRSVIGASRALEKLAELVPKQAHLLTPDGSTREVPVSELRAGDRLEVRPGERLPTDGTVAAGATSIDESLVTGESVPVPKAVDDEVIGGSINTDGSIDVLVTHTGEDSYLSQVVTLVRQAQESRSRTQDLADRAAAWLTVIALSASVITFLVWRLATTRDLAFALERAVTVMVITCPHALGLAIPLVVAVSTSLAARQGMLVRDRGAFEAARRVDTVLFDKTGTLTEGRFAVIDVLVSGTFSREEILGYAAAVEARSEHPIARGIAAEALRPIPAEEFLSLPGQGAQGRVDGRMVKVMNPTALSATLDDAIVERIDALAADGATTVLVIVDDEVIGAIALADVVRPQAREAVSRLQAMGISVGMLTGDDERVAAVVARELGLDSFTARVTPVDKAAEVRAADVRGAWVAMVGDGVNDAPALASADVGIAIGAGTDVAIESADIVLMRNDPTRVAALIELSRATYRTMQQNLAWATGYNAIAIPLAAGVLASRGIVLSPAVGAVLMSLSTVIVALNARLLGHRVVSHTAPGYIKGT